MSSSELLPTRIIFQQNYFHFTFRFLLSLDRGFCWCKSKSCIRHNKTTKNIWKISGVSKHLWTKGVSDVSCQSSVRTRQSEFTNWLFLVANSNSSISGGLSLSQSLTKSCHPSTCTYASMTLNSLYLCMHIRNLRFSDLVFSYFDFSLPQRLRLLSTGLARAAMGLPAVLSELPVRLLTLTLALL